MQITTKKLHLTEYGEKWIESEIGKCPSKWTELTADGQEKVIDFPVEGHEYRFDFEPENAYEAFLVIVTMRMLTNFHCRVFLFNNCFYICTSMNSEQLGMHLVALMNAANTDRIQQAVQDYERETK